MQKFAVLALVALLPACATVIEGTSDTVTLSTTTAGATCTKEGYQPATIAASSRFTGSTFGNVIAGGVIGVVVDAASGANNRYLSDVRLDLAENPGPPPPAPVAQMPAPSPLLRPAGHQRLQGPGM